MTKFRKFLCAVGLHRFGVWGEKFSIPGTNYKFEYQQRQCECCRYVQELRI